jgi:hypothetical protein
MAPLQNLPVFYHNEFNRGGPNNTRCNPNQLLTNASPYFVAGKSFAMAQIKLSRGNYFI